MDERLVEAAKRQAAARGTSVSRTVAAYGEALPALEAGDGGIGGRPVCNLAGEGVTVS